MQDGRRWKVFVDGLGLGALLLIDTSGNVDYLQQQIPMPVFAAWVRLVSRVRLDVKEVAARVEGYYDGMEDPSFYAARKLRPLRLERRAYRACSPGERVCRACILATIFNKRSASIVSTPAPITGPEVSTP